MKQLSNFQPPINITQTNHLFMFAIIYQSLTHFLPTLLSLPTFLLDRLVYMTFSVTPTLIYKYRVYINVKYSAPMINVCLKGKLCLQCR